MKTLIVLSVLAFLLCAFQVSNTSARTWYILPDGSGDAPTIQAGVDSASTGDVVELDDGWYRGEGNFDIDFLGKAITVRSQSGNPEVCIIDPEAGGLYPCRRGFFFLNGEDSSSILQGITVQNAAASNPVDECEVGGAVLCENSSPTITDCIFRNNGAMAGGGAICCANSSATITNCVFLENNAGGGAAIAFVNGSSPTITNCTFYRNPSIGNGSCIDILGTLLTISNSIISFSAGEWEWINHYDSPAAILTCCNIFGNSGGDWVESIADQIDLRGNFSAPPCFCDAENGDFHLCADSWCLPENHPWGCDELVGAYGDGCGECDCSSQGPVPAEVTAWGDVKALYRLS